MTENGKLYEFCFDNGLTIMDYLTLASFGYYQKAGIPQTPDMMTNFYKMAGKFCNYDPMQLDFREMANFTEQFTEALNKYMASVT